MYKPGRKMARQKWKEVADNDNSYELFQKSSRDQRSVREHFQKLLGTLRQRCERKKLQME